MPVRPHGSAFLNRPRAPWAGVVNRCFWVGLVAINNWRRRWSGLTDRLVHPSVRRDTHDFTRHHAFVTSHLAGGLLALAVLPVFALAADRIEVFHLVALGWLVLPVAIAAFARQTGRLAAAHLLSSANLAALAGYVALYTGGLQSFALAWLVVVPAEAALSGTRRVIAAAFLASCAVVLALVIVTNAGMVPESRISPASAAAFLAFGTLSAIAYVGGIALGVHRFHLRSEQSLRNSERRYRLLAENATDMITRHDRDGEITFASGAVGAVLGCAPGHLRGNALLERVHRDDRAAYLGALAAALETTGETSVEFRIARMGARTEEGPAADAIQGRDDGKYSWVEMRSRLMAGGDYAHCQIVAVTRDISERVARQGELKAALDAAQAANRAKTSFLANMSHELRTPLNAIIGFSEILQADDAGPESDKREYAGLIHQSGTHLLQVVNDLLDMSKIEAGRMEIRPVRFDLRDVVESCIQLMSAAAGSAGVAVTKAMPAQALELDADERACKQILLNLVSNAIKFSSPGGTVEISASPVNAGIRLRVRDEGVGIRPDVLPKLGKPFVQGDTAYSRQHEGTGLGLSVVKGLVDLHQGTFEIESQPGRGTCVQVWLPLEQGRGGEQCSRAGDGPQSEPGERPARRRIA